MRSLEKQLPLAALLLLAVVATSVTVVAYREVRATARELFGERLMRLSGELASTTGASILEARDALAQAAQDPIVIEMLADPESGDRDSTAALIASAMPEGQQPAFAGAWDLSGDLIVTTAATDTATWTRTPPPLVDAPTATPLTAENDTLAHYGIVAPVRDGRRLVGFLQVRQRLGGGGGSAVVEALVGESAQLLIGSPDGAWTDLRRVVPPPPSEVLGAMEAVAYERDGTRRLGVGRRLSETNFAIVSEINESVALASTRSFLASVALMAALFVTLATIAAWLLGRRITAPLGKLRAAAEGLAEGNYSRRAPESGHPEIVRVAATFNKMASETEGHVTALRASEQRFRSLVTATAQIVWWTDSEGNISEPLPSWQSYTGLTFEETRGVGWTGALHPDDASVALRAWKEAVQRRSLYEAEYRIRRHDGEYRWFVVRFVPVLDRDGTVREWVGTGADITERRETEEKLRRKELELQRSQRLDAVGRLAGGIAHDFNNLLTAILGPCELAMQMLPEDHPATPDLADIRAAAFRASELTRKLLVFGRQQVLAPTALDVNEAVEAATRVLRRVIGESVSLEFSANASDPTVMADRTQFDQIIMNLAVNARDAMPDGGRLTIETSNVDVDREMADEHRGLSVGNYVLLSVTDTGMGMDEDTLAHIFEPFFTTKDQDQGTGLGLSTVYGIVRQFGGEVLVYSEAGQGTSFKVYLPLAAHGEARDEQYAEAASRETARKGTETVLFAEDEATILRLGVRILSELGYVVLPAENGEEAIKLAENHGGEIDLLLSDVVMPEMNGIELWDRLRMSRPTLPALFLSGWASDAVIRHGILDGQVPFLQKPFTAAGLGSKVREVLDSPTSTEQ